jgi:hypothetical protein
MSKILALCALMTAASIPLSNKTTTKTGPSMGATPHATTSANIVGFDSDRWVSSGQGAKKEEHLGRQSLFLARGAYAYLKDVQFEDGTIEVDIDASQPRAFLGVVFRFQSEDEHEIVYLRPHKSGLEDATQYAPSFKGSTPWQLYSGPGFTAAVDIPGNRWLHVKIVVAGLTAKVYVNKPEPTLVVTDLKRGYGKGTIGLWGSAMGGHFSNFSYETSKPSADRPMPKHPAPAPGTLTAWELSDEIDTPLSDDETLSRLAAMKTMKWQAVGVEPPGMVVIDRYRRSPGILPPYANDWSKRLEPAKGAKTVFARTLIESDRDQIKKMSFGYSDEAIVSLNGKPVFSGRSAYHFRDPGFLGIMDVEDDTVYLPLKKGRNELDLAITEYFGGWGFICRVDDIQGLKLAGGSTSAGN